ncbi:hypothetical protein ACJMK2_036863 [Sinanodonta woodiana]|uniref:Uncharacterized protein n=1 Tax=Sinanodonta woodiana TaxID=1069815 RepID=A0ABD3WM29_SINWO
MEITPPTPPPEALNAVRGIGMRLATGWSLRASEGRTTLLHMWEKELQKRGIPNYSGQRRKKSSQRRETQPPTPPSMPIGHLMLQSLNPHLKMGHL